MPDDETTQGTGTETLPAAGDNAAAEAGAAGSETDGAGVAQGAEAGAGSAGAGTATWRLQQAASRAKLDYASLVERLGEEEAHRFLGDIANGLDVVARKMLDGSGTPPSQGAAAAPKPAQEFAIPATAYEPFEAPEAVQGLLNPVVGELNRMRGGMQELYDLVSVMVADGFFNGLGEEFGEMFGKGPTNPYSDEPSQKKRLDVMRQAERIKASYATRGIRVSPMQAYQEALSILAAGKQGEIARTQEQNRRKTRAGAVAVGPGARQPAGGAPKTLEQRKAQFAKGAGQILAGKPYHGPSGQR
jgi:hypothetical protein